MAEEHEGGGRGLLHKKLFGLPAPVVLGAGALLVWFVLSHRRAAGGGVAPTSAGAPDLSGGGGGAGTAMSLQDQLQAEQLGYRTALDQLNLEAARTGLSQAELPFQQQQAALTNFGSPATPVALGSQGGKTTYSYGLGPVSKAWQQVSIGGQTMWEDIFHPGHIISESQAQQLAPQDRGPYAQARGGFFQQLFAGFTGQGQYNQGIGGFLGSIGRTVAGFAGAGTPITVGTVGGATFGIPVGPKQQPQPVSTRVALTPVTSSPYYTKGL